MARVGESIQGSRIRRETGTTRVRLTIPKCLAESGDEDAVADCAGFQWLVGNEVSVTVTGEPRTIVSAAGIVVPRVAHQEGLEIGSRRKMLR